jgi:hypothetical protein
MNLPGYCTSASLIALRAAVSYAVLVSALSMQGCASQEMNATENAVAPSSNSVGEQPVQQDSTADIADPTPAIFTFERMYRDRYKTTPDEQE